MLAIQWGDPARGVGQPRLAATLHGRLGEVTPLQLDAATIEAAGGTRAVNGSAVVVEGDRAPGALGGAPSPLRVRSLRITRSPAATGGFGAAAVPDHKRYVTILCKFADSPSVEPNPKSTYVAWTGPSYPGLDHYWRRISYNQTNLVGSTVVGWYMLPQARAAYFDISGNANLTMLANDCTGAADADVDFRLYDGVNTQYNETLDCCSWGGSFWLTLDGVARSYGFTWMAGWASQSIYAHETGHSFGFPHSSGPYGYVYDSSWDVMSNLYVYYNSVRQIWIQQGTIAYHRDLAGWIRPSEKLTVGRGTERMFVLNRLIEPAGTQGYLMAEIPIATAPGEFYTLEARDLAGYDTPIPGRAVIIHHVRPYRGAEVVDPDNNGNVNDAGAMWTVGETFSDPVNGVTVSITGQTPTGFQVVAKYRRLEIAAAK